MAEGIRLPIRARKVDAGGVTGRLLCDLQFWLHCCVRVCYQGYSSMVLLLSHLGVLREHEVVGVGDTAGDRQTEVVYITIGSFY